MIVLSTLLLGGLAVAATLGQSFWGAELVADRAAIVQGEAWRLLTGPLFHADIPHLLRDVATLVPLGLGWGHRLGRRFIPFLVAALAVPFAATFVFEPDTGRLFGLSGATHALLVYALASDARRASWAWRLLCLAVVVKLAGELWTGDLLFPVEGLRAAVTCHVSGAALGLAVGLWRPGRNNMVHQTLTRRSSNPGLWHGLHTFRGPRGG